MHRKRTDLIYVTNSSGRWISDSSLTSLEGSLEHHRLASRQDWRFDLPTGLRQHRVFHDAFSIMRLKPMHFRGRSSSTQSVHRPRLLMKAAQRSRRMERDLSRLYGGERYLYRSVQDTGMQRHRFSGDGSSLTWMVPVSVPLNGAVALMLISSMILRTKETTEIMYSERKFMTIPECIHSTSSGYHWESPQRRRERNGPSPDR